MWMIIAAVAFGALSIGVLGWMAWRVWKQPQDRLAHVTPGHGQRPGVPKSSVARRRLDRAPALSRLLQGTPISKRLQAQILRAGWMLRPSELVALVLACGVMAGLVLATLTRAPILGPVGFLVGGVIPWLVLSGAQAQRNNNITEQLSEALDMMAGASRGGFSVTSGMELVTSQMHPPIADEFKRALEAVRLGLPLPRALEGVVMRTANSDMELVVSAIQIQSQVGGNLAEILDNTAEVMRERTRLKGEISVATAQGRLSAGVLMVLPFALAIIIQIMKPGYLEPLYTTTAGMTLSVIGMAGLLIGAIAMRRIVDVDI